MRRDPGAGSRPLGRRARVALALVAAGLAAGAAAQEVRTARQTPFPANPDFAALDVETLHVQGNVYLIAGAGANIAVQVGDDGVVMVDTGYAQMADDVLAAVAALTDRPIRTIVNTTLADDHTGANAQMVAAGRLNQAGPGMAGRPNEGDLVAHAELLRLMTEIGDDEIATDRWPPSTFSGAKKDFHANGEAIEIRHQPAATAGDSFVWFRGSDVIAAGELFNMTSFPYIDVEHGGTIEGILDGLNTLLDIIVPAHHQEGGTMVIPSHGRIGDEHDVLEYRDMLTIIRDRVQHAIDSGLTLAQIHALTPSVTYEYEPRFDRDPTWTARMFVEAIYRNLAAEREGS
ncbi:MAG TPA: MBL fold metallo-hydrolase [Gammaproteobacteria bacterium]